MAKQAPNTDPLLGTSAVCRELDCSRTTLWRLERDDFLPPPTIIRGRKFWRLSVIESLKKPDGTRRRLVPDASSGNVTRGAAA